MTENEAIKAIKDNKPTSGYYIFERSIRYGNTGT